MKLRELIFRLLDIPYNFRELEVEIRDSLTGNCPVAIDSVKITGKKIIITTDKVGT